MTWLRISHSNERSRCAYTLLPPPGPWCCVPCVPLLAAFCVLRGSQPTSIPALWLPAFFGFLRSAVFCVRCVLRSAAFCGSCVPAFLRSLRSAFLRSSASAFRCVLRSCAFSNLRSAAFLRSAFRAILRSAGFWLPAFCVLLRYRNLGAGQGIPAIPLGKSSKEFAFGDAYGFSFGNPFRELLCKCLRSSLWNSLSP